MTAQAQAATKTPPRILIQTFWMLHRAAYRVSRGRFGLTRPEAGERFGMMRLTTVGRRSGQRRTTMVGYYEDGPNLVTMAMNGWADADPAWWLNLQARPETTVDLPEGRRDVRARTAVGAERDRLWARFREFPGWGADIDALAARRSRETTVVIFEPAARLGGPGAADAAEAGGASRTTAAAPTKTDQFAVQPTASSERNRRGPKARHLLLIPGLAIAVYANAVAGEHNLGLVPLLAFGIMPHLAVLTGIGQPHAHGQLAPRAVPLFNAMHHPVVPLALLAVAATGLLAPFWYVGALAWLSHIVMDWAFGDGLRTPDGFRRQLLPVVMGERLP